MIVGFVAQLPCSHAGGSRVRPQKCCLLSAQPVPLVFFKLGDAASIKNSLEKKNALTRQLLARMQALPGVTSVSELNNPPPLTSETSDTIIPGKPHAERWETTIDECSEGYFQTLGLPLLRGRLLSVDDVSSARHVAVVNETFAHRYFPNEDAVGHKIKFGNLDLPFVETPHDIYIFRNRRDCARFQNPRLRQSVVADCSASVYAL